MTQHVPDSVIATFARQEHDWMERVLKGSLDPVRVARAVQALIDQGSNCRLTIDYGRSLEQMVADGRYDWVNGDITAKRFPITGTGVIKVEHKLFHFDRTVSPDEAERLIIDDGWQPAKIEHLLAYGTVNPEEQRKFPITALGSVAGVDGGRLVPFLCGVGSGRSLSLCWRSVGWDGHDRFMAVRNLAL